MVSVIVPIYNVEIYLRRCVNSLLKQTYKDIEIILVDDGSTDGSKELCDDLAFEDNRIKVIHKTNGGLSSARNAGIDIAKGEWYAFIDSDDIVDSRFIQTLLENAIRTECLISQCEFVNFVQEDILKHQKISEEIYIVDRKDVLKQIDNTTNTIVCNKLYHRSLFSDLRFPEGRVHEDVAITYKLFYAAKKACGTFDVLYFYYCNENSITQSKITVRKLDLIDAYYEQVCFFKDKGLNECQVDAMNRLIALFGTLSASEKNRFNDYEQFQKQLLQKYQKIRPEARAWEMRFDLKVLLLIAKDTLIPFRHYHRIKCWIKSFDKKR